MSRAKRLELDRRVLATRLAPVGRVIALPPVLGALWVTGWLFVSTRGPVVEPDEVVLGAQAREISSLVVTRYGALIRRIEIDLVLASLAFGAAIGVAAWLLLAFRKWFRNPPESIVLRIVVVVGMHLAPLALSMAKYPALYERVAYRAGGVSRHRHRESL